MVQQLLDGMARREKAVALGLLQCLEVLVRGDMVQDQKDREVPEEHPGFAPQQPAEAVAIHRIAARVHQNHVGVMPGILGQPRRPPVIGYRNPSGSASIVLWSIHGVAPGSRCREQTY